MANPPDPALPWTCPLCYKTLRFRTADWSRHLQHVIDEALEIQTKLERCEKMKPLVM